MDARVLVRAGVSMVFSDADPAHDRTGFTIESTNKSRKWWRVRCHLIPEFDSDHMNPATRKNPESCSPHSNPLRNSAPASTGATKMSFMSDVLSRLRRLRPDAPNTSVWLSALNRGRVR